MDKYKILIKKELNPTVCQMEIYAPLVAQKAKPGQFIILRVDENGERIPLTVAGVDKERGAVKIIFQIVGASTKVLSSKQEGECIADFVGPLGKATEIEGIKKACIIGGGVGCAIAMPVAQALHAKGAEVVSITGFRNRDLVILEEEFKECSDRLFLMTDDGTYGEKGNVCMPLEKLLSSGESFDIIIAIGPIIMMKFVTETAKPYGVPVTVSMNPIMIDGTGMCGGCRLTLDRDGERITKFACVDGPDFNGYEVDFDEAASRGRMYSEFERHAYSDTCDLLAKAKEA